MLASKSMKRGKEGGREGGPKAEKGGGMGRRRSEETKEANELLLQRN